MEVYEKDLYVLKNIARKEQQQKKNINKMKTRTKNPQKNTEP